MENEKDKLKEGSKWEHSVSENICIVKAVDEDKGIVYYQDEEAPLTYVSMQDGIGAFLSVYNAVEEVPVDPIQVIGEENQKYIDAGTKPLEETKGNATPPEPEIKLHSKWVGNRSGLLVEVIDITDNFYKVQYPDGSTESTSKLMFQDCYKPSDVVDRINGLLKDDVNQPAHYTTGTIEVIDFIEDQKLGFHEATIVQYVVRAPHKNGLEDLKKAQWYLNRLVKQKEKEINNGK